MSNDPKQEKREIAGRAKMLKFEGETEQVRRLAEDVLTLLGRVDEAEAKVTGWVSPEEAKAREDAARREALLEAAEEAPKQAEWIEMMRGQKAALAAKLAQAEDDLAAARAGIERLQDWKASASDVMLGLQDVGKALGLPLGSSITGTLAAETAERLKDKVARVEAVAEEWANDQGILSPDSRYTRNVLVHELVAALAEPERDEESGR